MKRFPRAFARIFFVTWALVLLESIFQGLSHYSFASIYSYLHPLIIFGGLAFGNVIGLVVFPNWSSERRLFVAMIATAVSWIGVATYDVGTPIWLILPFLAFGVVFVDYFSKDRLRDLIIASGAVGVTFFLTLPITGSITYETGLFIALVCMALAGIVSSDDFKTSARWVSAILVVFIFWSSGSLTIPSILAKLLPQFRRATPIEEPYIKSFFRTDLVRLASRDRYALVMNGARYGVLPKEEYKEEGFNSDEEVKFVHVTHEIPYLFGRKPESVLVIGSAEGKNILMALANGAKSITAVDINPAVFHFLKDRRPDLGGRLYTNPKVESVRAEGRYYLETTDRRFDLITLQGVQTGTTATGVSTALLESFLFTEEALLRLWDRITENGYIFFDEYQTWDGIRENSDSLLTRLASSALNKLPIYDPSRQIIFFTYLQSIHNPKSVGGVRRVREGLLIFKRPVEDLEAAKARVRSKYNEVQFRDVRNLDYKPVLDDRPFFVQEKGLAMDAVYSMTFFSILSAIAVVLIRRREKKLNDPARPWVNAGLFCLGASYILLVMAMVGPLTLVAGEPFLLSALMYFILYFVALLGGLWALQRGLNAVLKTLLPCTLLLLIAWFGLQFFKPDLIASSSFLLRVLAVMVVFGAVAFGFEVPYVVALKSVEGTERGAAYTYENLGTLVGGILSLITQVGFGFSGTFIVGLLFLVCAGLLFVYVEKGILKGRLSG